MKRIDTIIKRLKKVSELETLMKAVFRDPYFKKLIVELNTIDQLYNKGVDSLGRSLGDYRPATIEGTVNFPGKIDKNQRYDHVTLRDTGAFYDSFKVYLVGVNIKITANTIKDGEDLLDTWGKEVLGLTEENLQKVRIKAREIIVPYVKEYLLAA